MIDLFAQPGVRALIADSRVSPVIRLHRTLALQVMQAALDAVDPAEAVRRAVTVADGAVVVAGRHYALADYDRVTIVGAGKAGASMATSLWEVLAGSAAAPLLAGGVVIVKEGHLPAADVPGNMRFVEGSHPILNAAGVAATDEIVRLVGAAGERDLVFALLSGGGSALLEAPVPQIDLPTMQALTEAMLRSGATISQLNAVRKHLSQVKGGRLARIAAPATVVALILSDVVGSPLDVIASGPTAPDPTTFADVWAILHDLGLVEAQTLPPFADAATLLAQARPALDYIATNRTRTDAETPKPGDPVFARVQNVIIGDNRVAALAARDHARELTFDAAILSTHLEGEAREIARLLVGIARSVRENEADTPFTRPACLIFGGESTVTVRGGGLGGRNQEMALAAAIALDGLARILVIPLATDGSDGPNPAAGAMADAETLERARDLGLDAADYLRRNDAYHFFEQEGGLLTTGPTHTNVNDLIFVFIF